MNFGANDPLADLLSDNSNENDNIFENPNVFRKGKSSSGNTTTSNKTKAASSRLDDLFGIQEEIDDGLTNFKREQVKPTAATTPRQSDDDDLGFDPRKPKGTKSATNIFSDLLGDGGSVAVAKKDDASRPIMSRQSTDTTTDNSNIVAPTRPKTSTGRRSSGMSGITNTDPLGLFSTPNAATPSGQGLATASNLSTPRKSTSGTKKRGTTVDWLGLSGGDEASKNNPQTDETSSKDSPRLQHPKQHQLEEEEERPYKAQVPAPTHADLVEVKQQTSVGITSVPIAQHNELQQGVVKDDIPMTFASRAAVDNMFLMNTLNLESRGTSTLLEQQESQLALAAQMQQHERVLNDMMRKQDTLLKKQEQEFLGVIRQQMQRQQIMEENIKMQQERINAHLMLLKQPPNAFNLLTEGIMDKNVSNTKNNTSENNVEPQKSNDAAFVNEKSEMELKRLEFEKLRFEKILVNTKAQYEREVELMEKSYKKQIELIEQQSSSIEGRLKSNIEELVQFFDEKCEVLSQENLKNKNKYETQITELKQEHASELAEMRQGHLRDLDILKEEHKRMIETLREAKTLENSVLQDGDSLLNTMNQSSVNLKNIGESLLSLRNDIQTRLNEANEGKARELQLREQRLSQAELQLKETHANIADDNKRLRELVTELEEKINTLTKQSTVESRELRIRVNELEAEKAAFERERDFHRETMQRETKRLTETKEIQLNEIKAMQAKLEEERRRLQTERAHFQTSQQLEMPSAELESQKAELNAKMQAAEEAVRKANNNMGLLSQWQQKLEADRQKILAQEEELSNRERELAMQSSAIERTEIEAKAERTRALLAQKSFETKLKLLQQQQCALAEKEANLQNERMLLVQERIALKSIRNHLRGAGKFKAWGEASLYGGDNQDLLPMQATKILKSNSVQDLDLANDMNRNIAFSQKLNNTSKKNNNNNAEYSNAVDRLLDRDIADSYMTMRTSVPALTNNFQVTYENSVSSEIDDDNLMIAEVLRGLDDDSKSLALNNLTTAYTANNSNNDDLLLNRFDLLDRNLAIHLPSMYGKNEI